MASKRSDFGGLVAVALTVAFVVTGCGGGSSSAPGTASSTAASTPSAARSDDGAASARQAKEIRRRPPKRAVGRLKHPPIQLPAGRPEKGPTKAQQARVPTVDISLSLPRGIGRSNTCKGKDVSPELRWGAAPADAVELVVFAANLQPVDGKLHFDWAMAGLRPSLEGLKEGEVPKGAVLGRNGDGQDRYSLCPPGSGTETYVFSVYPVTKSLSPKRGFDPLAMRKAATPVTEKVGIYPATYSVE